MHNAHPKLFQLWLWAHLQYPSDKNIDILDALVERLQPRHHHGGEDHGEALPAGEGGQGTEPTPRHVARQPVVTRPLYIQRHQVHPKTLTLLLEPALQSEPEFLNFLGAQESIPRNQFRQPMWPGGPVR